MSNKQKAEILEQENMEMPDYKHTASRGLDVETEIIENQKLKDFENYMCSKFIIYPIDGMTRMCPTEEPYITYTSNGVKPEGYGDEPESSINQAVNGYIDTISELLRHMKGTLYWRKRPELRFKPEHYEDCIACEEAWEDYEFDKAQGHDVKEPVCPHCKDRKIYIKSAYNVRSRFIISEMRVRDEIVEKYFNV